MRYKIAMLAAFGLLALPQRHSRADFTIEQGLGAGYKMSFSRDKRGWSRPVPAEDDTRIKMPEGDYYVRILTPQNESFVFPNRFRLELRKKLILGVYTQTRTVTVMVDGRKLTRTENEKSLKCNFKFRVRRARSGANFGITVREPSGESGPVITQIDAGGPARRAGLRVGDVIVQVGGSSTGGVDSLVNEIQRTGNPVNVVVDRNAAVTMR